MAAFDYIALDAQGKEKKGVVEGDTARQVRQVLRDKGLTTLEITESRKKAQASNDKAKSVPGFLQRGISSTELALLTRQLATLIQAALPLDETLSAVAEQTEKQRIKSMLYAIRSRVLEGHSLAVGLGDYPKVFPELYRATVDAGEQSGSLETMLDRIASYKEKTESLKAKVRKAMTYPIAVVVVAFIVSGILLIKVVPQFESVFAGFGAELPAFTLFVIGISNFVRAYYLIMIVGLAGLFIGFAMLRRRSKPLRDTLDRLALKMPVMGNIIEKSAVARYARTLSTTFAAGVPLVEALNSVAGATGNSVYVEAVYKIRDDVSTGQQLNYAMRSTGVFPNMVNQMVAIGEESGALDDMLDKSASYYEEQVNNAVDNLTALMEPMIMSVLGVLVGGLIIAMYLPIFQLGGVVGGGG